MKIKRLATALDKERVPDNSDHAAGFVSKMMARREVFCSVSVREAHPA